MSVQKLRSAIGLEKLSKFLVKKYRDSYLESMVRTGISAQVYALRKKAGLTQLQFAERAGKPQSTISRLENETYGKVTVTSLLDIAKANDVGLIVRFVDYPTVLKFAGQMSEEKLQPDTVFESIEGAKLEPARWRGFLMEELKQGQKQQPQIMTSTKSSDAIWSRSRGQLATRNYLENAYATN